MGDKRNLLLLFDRPQEPVFVPKGTNKKAFDVPNDYLVKLPQKTLIDAGKTFCSQADRYKPIGAQLANRFGEDTNEKIPVKQISIPPLGDILELGRNENFSLFMPRHRQMAGHLIRLFMGKIATSLDCVRFISARFFSVPLRQVCAPSKTCRPWRSTATTGLIRICSTTPSPFASCTGQTHKTWTFPRSYKRFRINTWTVRYFPGPGRKSPSFPKEAG